MPDVRVVRTQQGGRWILNACSATLITRDGKDYSAILHDVTGKIKYILASKGY